MTKQLRPSTTFPGWKPSGKRPLTGEPIRFANGMQWEMDSVGNHRVVDAKGVGGDWTHYPGIAVSPDGRYICLSAYWEGALPSEQLLRVEVVATET